MSFASVLLPEFDEEMALTRKTIERVPDDKFGWKPHPKSLSFGDLVTHLVNLPTWTGETMAHDTFDMAPPGGEPLRAEPVESAAAALAKFDENVAAARAAIEEASDERFLTKWTLLAGGEVVLTLPRLAVVRTFVVNHMIHHRAQLGVYLRLNDLPVPSVYGSSADESG